jgi:fructosamine-3-kinase
LRSEHLRAFDHLHDKLDALVGPSEPPARLHGDLWSGTVHVDEHGAPVLIDPAVYGGHREMDLAMLSLFGAPSARFYAAYDEVYPRAPGHAERVALYQLYPLLVHLNLFGGGYLAQLRSALASYA